MRSFFFAAVLVGVSIHLVEVMSKKYTTRQITLEHNTFFGENGWLDSMWKGKLCRDPVRRPSRQLIRVTVYFLVVRKLLL